ncbi:hypothetical protein ACQPZJ_30440 [Actinoplanes sp. CA-054009]
MILTLVRHRRKLLLTAVVVAVLAVAGAVRDTTEPGPAVVATLILAGVALLAAAVSRRPGGGAGFDQDFRTPRGATPLFVGLALLALLTAAAEFGGWAWAHGEPGDGGFPLILLLAVATAGAAPTAWRGAGITLTPDGIRADHLAGRTDVPWTALAPERPFRGSHHLDLRLAHPDQVKCQGLVVRRQRLPFETTSPDLVAAAIRHYADHPAVRPTIGTPAGYRHLGDLIHLPIRSPAPAPVLSGKRVAALAAAAAVTFPAGITLLTVSDGERHGVGRILVEMLGWSVTWTGMGLAAEAWRGLRARRG